MSEHMQEGVLIFGFLLAVIAVVGFGGLAVHFQDLVKTVVLRVLDRLLPERKNWKP